MQFRIEAFNFWNWHSFTNVDNTWGNQAFNNDIASGDFGTWNGAVSRPRSIQLAARFEF